MEYQWSTQKDKNGEHFLKRYFEFLFFAILKQMLKQLFYVPRLYLRISFNFPMSLLIPYDSNIYLIPALMTLS